MGKISSLLKSILYVDADEDEVQVEKPKPLPTKQVVQQQVEKVEPPNFITLEKPKPEVKVEPVKEEPKKEVVKKEEPKKISVPYKMTGVISPVYGEKK